MGAEQSSLQHERSSSTRISSEITRPRPPRNHSSASTATLEPPRKIRLDDLVQHASPANHATGFDAPDTPPSRIDQRAALPLSPLNRLKSTKTQLSPVLLSTPTQRSSPKSRSVSPTRRLPLITAETLNASPEGLALIHRRSLLYAASPGSQTRRPKESNHEPKVNSPSTSVGELTPPSRNSAQQQCPIHEKATFVTPKNSAAAAYQRSSLPLDRGATPVPVSYSVGPYRQGTLRIVNLDDDADDADEVEEPDAPSEYVASDLAQTQPVSSTQRRDQKASEAHLVVIEQTSSSRAIEMGASGSKQNKPVQPVHQQASAPAKKLVQSSIKSSVAPRATDAAEQPSVSTTTARQQIEGAGKSTVQRSNSVRRQGSGASSVRSAAYTDFSAPRCESSCSSAVSESVPAKVNNSTIAAKSKPAPRAHGKSRAGPEDELFEHLALTNAALSLLTKEEADLISSTAHKPFRVGKGRGRSIEQIMQIRQANMPTSPTSTADSLTSASTRSSVSSGISNRTMPSIDGRRSRVSTVPIDYEPFGPISPITLQSETKFYKAPAHYSAQRKLNDPDLGMRKGKPRPIEQLVRRSQQPLVRSGSENVLIRVRPRGPRPVTSGGIEGMKRGVSMGCLAEVSAGNQLAPETKPIAEKEMRSVSFSHVKQVRVRHLAGEEA